MPRGSYIRTPEHKKMQSKILKKKCVVKHGADHPNWKGGKFVSQAGYVFIKDRKHPFCNKRGYVREHRVVMEKYLGRYLDPWEVVHHKNNDKLDNCIENLMLFKNHSEHVKGNIPWNKGMPCSEETKEKIRKTKKAKKYGKESSFNERRILSVPL